MIKLAGVLCFGQTSAHSIDSAKLRNTIKNLKIFNDDFEGALKDFWMTNEYTGTTRYSIVRDPLDPEKYSSN